MDNKLSQAQSNGRRQNLKQEVATHLRDEIFSGALKPGVRIDQDGLAAAVGVSRLPVREALIQLEGEGMVVNVPRRGAFVAPLEPEDIEDHFEMYGVLSGVAAARAASLGSAQLVADITEVSASMRRATDPDAHDRLNFTFHQLINKAGGSRRLISVLRTLSDNMPSHFFTSNNEWEFRERAFAEHDVIIEAIKAEDSDGAAKAVAVHFKHVGEQAVRSLRSTGFWSD
jgi:DNA-binding GntR family transcriptional regulator